MPDVTNSSSKVHQAVIIALVTLLAVGIVAGGAMATPVTDEVESAERTINETTADPGDHVSVTVTVTISEDGEKFSLTESFNPAFADVETDAIQHNGEFVTAPVAFIADDETVVAAIEEPLEAGDTVTVSYDVIIPEDATQDDTFSIAGETGLDDQEDIEVSGDDSITMETAPDDPVANLTANDTTVAPSDGIQLDASDSEGSDLTYDWAFDDGTRIDDADPIVEHAYTEPGEYNVTVTVTDDEGRTDTANATIIVSDEAMIAHRGLNTEEATPGDVVQVTIEVELLMAGDRFSLDEAFDPAFENAEPIEIVYNGAQVTNPVAFLADNEVILAAMEEEFTEHDTISITYEVTVPDETDKTFTFNGNVGLDDLDNVTITGDDELTVDEPTPPAINVEMVTTPVNVGQEVEIHVDATDGVGVAFDEDSLDLPEEAELRNIEDKNEDEWIVVIEFTESTWMGDQDGEYGAADTTITVIDEFGDTANGTASTEVRIAGDVTGDGEVMITDLRTLALAYGEEADDPDYDQAADLTNSGAVDIRDLAILSQHWSKTAWEEQHSRS